MRRALGCLALLAGLLLLPGSAGAAPWSAPAPFYQHSASPSASIVSPAAVVLPNGDGIVVYRSQVSGNLESRRRAAGGSTFDAPKTIGAYPGWEAPRLAVDSAGTVTVAYVAGPAVKTSTLPTPTGEWTAPVDAYVPVEANTYTTSIAAFHVTPSGRAVLALEATYEIFSEQHAVRVLTREGGTWSGYTTVESGPQSYLGIDADINDAGQGVLTYTRRTGTPSNWYYRVDVSTRASGAGWTEPITVSDIGDGNNQFPVTAIDDAGRITVVWGRYTQGVTRNLATAGRNTAGEWSAATEFLVPGTGKFAEAPTIDTDSTGRVLLAYQHYTQPPENNLSAWSRQVAVMERPLGGAWSNSQTLSTGKDNGVPRELRATPDGAAAMVWLNYDAPTKVILGHRLVDGTWSTPETVNTLPTQMQAYAPSLGLQPGKQALVAWGRLSSDYTNSWGEASWGTPSAPDLTAPDTSITGGTSGSAPGKAASFEFSAPGETGATFECRLDRAGHAGTWGACTSPKVYADLGPAPYTFRVRAIDAAANVDQSPATQTFTLQPLGGAPGAKAGSLDGTYGHGGSFYDWTADGASDVVRVAGDKMVVASDHFGLARFNTDGTIDTTFGDQGEAAAQFGTATHGTRGAIDIAQAPDGKLVTISSWWDGSAWNLGIARYTADGVLDQTFSNDGVLSHSPNDALVPVGVHVQSDGAIVAVLSVHYLQFPALRSILLVRYTPAGEIDDPYGVNGQMSYRPGAGHCFPSTSLLQPDDRLVIAGHCDDMGTRFHFAARFDNEGESDATFGNGQGLATVSKVNFVSSIARQADGKLLLAGRQSPDGVADDAGIERLNANGTLDDTFGTGGLVRVPAMDSPADILAQDDGRIVMSSAHLDAYSLTRRNADGSPDESFGQNGVAIFSPGVWRVSGGALARQSDGKYVFAGGVVRNPQTDGDYRMMLARIQAATPPDTVAPDTLLDSGPPNGATLPAGTVAYGFSSDDTGATFECSLQGPGQTAQWGACASPKEYGGLANGAYTFSVRAKDAANNLDATPVVRTFTVDAPVPPANDAFSAPAVLSGLSAVGGASTLGAGREAGEPLHDGKPGGGSAWWTWQADSVRDVVLNTCGSSFDTLLAVYTGAALGSLTPVASDDDDDGGCGSASRLQFRSVAGQTYRIAVDGYEGARGTVVLNLNSTAPDLTAPTVSITSGPVGTTSATRAEFGFAASETGATFRCSLDGGTPLPCEPGVGYDVAGGSHTFAVVARDAALNESVAATRAWTVDPAAGIERHELAAGASTPAATAAGGVQVTSPVAGTVTFTALAPGAAPSGYSVFGFKYEITAPAASAANPLRLVFRANAAELPAGVDETNVTAFRDGVPIALCTTADGTATPAPCIAQRRKLGDGDLEITVLSDHASAWNLGRANPPVTGGGGGGGGGEQAGTGGGGSTTTTPPGGQGPSIVPPVLGAPVVAITFPKGVKLLPSLKNGFVVSGTTSTAAKITGTVSISAATAKKLRLGRKALKVASAQGSFGAGGFSLEFKPAKKLRKKLAKAKVLSLVLRGTAVGPTGLRTTFKRSISLRR